MSHSILRILVYIRVFIFILFSFINEISEAAHFRGSGMKAMVSSQLVP